MLKKLFTILVYLFAAVGFLLTAGYFAVRFGFTNEPGIIDTQRETFLEGVQAAEVPETPAYTGPWQQSEEWSILESAIRRDQAVLTKAAADADVPARLIAASLVAEQLRLFFTEREAYKRWFYPLKILGPQTQFSWGVMGMKEETAIKVEEHLKDPTSPYYLGPAYEHLLDFKTADIKQERFTRMTDQHDHYYSYLYAGIYLKQLMNQWERAGYPIDNNPGVVSTLFNIGFTKSVPKPNPQMGGAALTIAGKTYSFGGIAAEFYASDLLIDILPK